MDLCQPKSKSELQIYKITLLYMYNINYQRMWSEAFSKSNLLESWPFNFKLFASRKPMTLLFLIIYVSGAIYHLMMLMSACNLSCYFVPWFLPINDYLVTHLYNTGILDFRLKALYLVHYHHQFKDLLSLLSTKPMEMRRLLNLPYHTSTHFLYIITP